MCSRPIVRSLGLAVTTPLAGGYSSSGSHIWRCYAVLLIKAQPADQVKKLASPSKPFVTASPAERDLIEFARIVRVINRTISETLEVRVIHVAVQGHLVHLEYGAALKGVHGCRLRQNRHIRSGHIEDLPLGGTIVPVPYCP